MIMINRMIMIMPNLPLPFVHHKNFAASHGTSCGHMRLVKRSTEHLGFTPCRSWTFRKLKHGRPAGWMLTAATCWNNIYWSTLDFTVNTYWGSSGWQIISTEIHTENCMNSWDSWAAGLRSKSWMYLEQKTIQFERRSLLPLCGVIPHWDKPVVEKLLVYFWEPGFCPEEIFKARNLSENVMFWWNHAFNKNSSKETFVQTCQ